MRWSPSQAGHHLSTARRAGGGAARPGAGALDPTATRPMELLGDVKHVARALRAGRREVSGLPRTRRQPGPATQLGLARYRGAQVEAAVAPLRAAVERDRSLAAAHLLLGLCLRDLNELTAARTALETVTQLARAHGTARGARLALREQRADRAIEQLEALVALDTARPGRLVALGRAYADAGRHDAAIMTLGRAVERFPDSAQTYGASPVAPGWRRPNAPRAGSAAKAVEALSTAASHSDVSSETLTDLGRAWMLSGNAAESERVAARRREAAGGRRRAPASGDDCQRSARLQRPARRAATPGGRSRAARGRGHAHRRALAAARRAASSVALGGPRDRRRGLGRHWPLCASRVGKG